MTTQETEPLSLPQVSWGYTSDTGQLMASCWPHDAYVHKDPKTGQPVFQLTIRDCAHEDGRPMARDLCSRQGIARTQRDLAILKWAVAHCQEKGLLTTPHTPAMRNNLSLLALLEALVGYGRKR
jgi:hypothetical protein